MANKKQESSTEPVALTAARPMYSQSPVFEAGYGAFIAEVFELDIVSVRTEESSELKAIAMADIHRLVMVKRTGLLHFEQRGLVHGRHTGLWEKRSGFPVPYFWLTETEAAAAACDAWRWRVMDCVPSAEVCYPDGVPLTHKNSYRAAANMWSTFVDLAAARRIGGRENKRATARIFIGQLWNFLVDRDTLRLCHAYFGRRASLADYNFTVRRAKELNARMSETPGLSIIVGAYIRADAKLRTGRAVLPTDIVARVKGDVFRVPGNPHESQSDRLLCAEPLSPAGWRFLAASSRTMAEHLWNMMVSRDETFDTPIGLARRRLAPVLNLLATLDERPPLALVKWVCHTVSHTRAAKEPKAALANLQRFLRLATRQANIFRKKGRLKQFISHDLSLAWDWFKRDEDRREELEPSQVSKQATWASVMRAQHTWHLEREERARQRRLANEELYRQYRERQESTKWESAVGEMLIEGIQVAPLTTGKALAEEGTRMDHCVFDYIDDCAKGSSRIFSMALAEEHATVELRYDRGSTWRIGQVFGPGNSGVSPAIRKASKALAHLYGEKLKSTPLSR